MTPAARLQTAIEILDDILAAVRSKGAAADTMITQHLRSKRYAGAKDRAAIRSLIFQLLREDAVLADRVDARAVAIRAALHSQPDLLPLFGAGGYGPPEMTSAEKTTAAADAASTQKSVIDALLALAFHDTAACEYQALLARASVDLRCGADSATRDMGLRALQALGLPAAVTGWSGWGLRLPADTQLPQDIFARLPMLDVQDEGSQLVAQLTQARPGDMVIDLCAGAGGKSLALAAMMESRGRLIAYDRAPSRLERLAPRAARAGVAAFIETHTGDLAAFAGKADRVLVDAPCSGSGTWRRNPEARLRLTTASIEQLVATQRQLIAQAAWLARPGGHIVYAVCSWLVAEGEAHLDKLPEGLRIVDWRDLWRADQPMPETASLRPECLKLTPYRHGCDGFFIVCLQKL